MMQGWRNILGPLPVFPREVLVQIPGARMDKSSHDWERNGKYAVTVRNLEQYMALVAENAARRDLWVGWSPANRYDDAQMEWAYGDVDDPDLEVSLDMARSYEDECRDLFGVRPAVLFSCGKGFHMHFTHDPVKHRGVAYSDALRDLVDTDLDPGPLKHRTAKPRIPYTINLNATTKHLEPMYVVPVDLSWDLDEIVERAKACETKAFTVPHSTKAADLIGEKADRIEARLRRARSKPRDAQREKDSVQVALQFARRNGPFMVDRHGRSDGRKRVMYNLLIPALMHEHGGDEVTVLAEAQEFVADCGASWSKYHAYTLQCIRGCVLNDGSLRMPMGLGRWLTENAGLRWPR